MVSCKSGPTRLLMLVIAVQSVRKRGDFSVFGL